MAQRTRAVLKFVCELARKVVRKIDRIKAEIAVKIAISVVFQLIRLLLVWYFMAHTGCSW